VKENPPTTDPIRPLVSAERMAAILSSRRSLTSVETYRKIEMHLGRPLLPGRKKVSVNGQTKWVSC